MHSDSRHVYGNRNNLSLHVPDIQHLSTDNRLRVHIVPRHRYQGVLAQKQVLQLGVAGG